MTFQLYNNSGIDQTITINEKIIPIKTGRSKRVTDIEYSTFSISSDSETNLYSVPSISHSNVTWRGWGPFTKRMLYLQLEADGSIWITRSRKRATKFGKQPGGFPVQPNT